MVLGISLRRKKKEEPPTALLAPSPSLPEVSSSDLSWPSDFIADAVPPATDVPDDATPVIVSPDSPGREPIRKRSIVRISYHRPFPKDDDQQPALPSSPPTSNGLITPHSEHDRSSRPSIASIYASPPSKAFVPPPRNNRSFSSVPKSSLRNAHTASRGNLITGGKRRAPHAVPTFNIMLAGASKTGKTSLARLLLQTCLVSPFPSTSSNPAQQVALAAFLRGSVRTTTMIESASLEIDEGPERIALTVLDTPGLLLGNDLDLERSVTSITRHLDARFAETLEEENKVDRRNKGDQHVHLCIYLIAPEAIRLEAVKIPVPHAPAPVQVPASADTQSAPVLDSPPAQNGNEEPGAPKSVDDPSLNPSATATSAATTVNLADHSSTAVGANGNGNVDGGTGADGKMSSEVIDDSYSSPPADAPVRPRPSEVPPPIALPESEFEAGTRAGIVDADKPRRSSISASTVNAKGDGTPATPRPSTLPHSRPSQSLRPNPPPPQQQQEYRTEYQMRLSPSDISVITRLSSHVNVLPVISRADTMTNERLEEVKAVVRRDLKALSLGSSKKSSGRPSQGQAQGGYSYAGILRQLAGESDDVFDSDSDASDDEDKPPRSGTRGRKHEKRGGKTPRSSLDNDEDEDEGSDSDSDSDSDSSTVSASSVRPSIVVRIRSTDPKRLVGSPPSSLSSSTLSSVPVPPTPTSHSGSMRPHLPMSRSGSRLRARAASTNEDIDFENAIPREALASGSGGSVRKVFPFAIMSPDPPVASPPSPQDGGGGANGHENGSACMPAPPPSSYKRRSMTISAMDHLAELKGKYTRNYRWGSVDVMNPEHCDFLTLRHAILGPRMRVLKQTTNEVLYENYRTQKLIELKQLSASTPGR